MEPDKNQDINVNRKSNVTLFVMVGIVILSIIMIVGFGVQVLPGTITVSSTGSKRDLPIYCVDLQEKKVALSFDTAWGNGWVG